MLIVNPPRAVDPALWAAGCPKTKVIIDGLPAKITNQRSLTCRTRAIPRPIRRAER